MVNNLMIKSTNCGAFHEGLKVEENGEELPDPWGIILLSMS